MADQSAGFAVHDRAEADQLVDAGPNSFTQQDGVFIAQCHQSFLLGRNRLVDDNNSCQTLPDWTSGVRC